MNVKDIKTTTEYFFVSDCGHEFLSLPQRAIKNKKVGCPFCSGRRVLNGFNDIWTTNPELASILQTPEDGYVHTLGSNRKVAWTCPDCGNVSYKSPNKMNQTKSFCLSCNRISSYGEKFIASLLDQLCVPYEREKVFLWSNSKRYDFYLPTYGYIVEIHGPQHFSSRDFSKFGGRSYLQEQNNDNHKKRLAFENGINVYIVIKNLNSNKDTMIESIANSLLPTLLFFSVKDIDWDSCHKLCLSSKTKAICDYYESTEKDIAKIAEQFQCCYNTVRKRLKDGALVGLCSYSAEQASKDGTKKMVDNMLKNRTKPVVQIDIETGLVVGEYDSIQSAQRKLNISHIWDCIVGKRKTAGSYTWKYKKEYAKKNTSLPDEPDYDAIDEFVADINERVVSGKLINRQETQNHEFDLPESEEIVCRPIEMNGPGDIFFGETEKIYEHEQ